MTTIRSTWTHPTPPPLTGLLDAADWSGAARMSIPSGTLMAQNDGAHLYIGLDLTAETGAADPGDYFWFVVDINDNGIIDARRDKLFSDWPGTPNRLGMWLMAGVDTTYPASNTQVIPSQVRIGFGPSTGSATAHRQWEIVFALSDLGIDPIDPAASSAPSPIVRFGLRIASSHSIAESPANPLASFLDFHEIILAPAPNTVPSGAGPVIASVGLIGTGLIAADGYCNIPSGTPNYYIQPQDAAFSGTLNLIGNHATLAALWAAGARKYKVMHRAGATAAAATAAAWEPILQTWSNYQVVGTTDVPQAFAPDASGFYPMVDPSLQYTIQDLVFQWATASEPDLVHQLEFAFFNAGGGTVTSTAQTVTLKLDNQPATVDVSNILWSGAPVGPCAIVNLTAAMPGVQIAYEAYDPEGDLWSYSLTAEWGHGQGATLFADDYTHHRSASHNWQGLLSDTQPPAETGWVPPTTCAYLFEVSAWTRTTNGYQFPCLQSTDFQTVTLIKPNVPNVIVKPLAAAAPVHAAPAGFEAAATTPQAASIAVKALAVKDLKDVKKG